MQEATRVTRYPLGRRPDDLAEVLALLSVAGPGVSALCALGRVSGGPASYPFWVFTTPDGAGIERYVPAMPLRKETARYARLQRTVGAYRMVMGQSRQDDLLRYAGPDVADWYRIDLTPP